MRRPLLVSAVLLVSACSDGGDSPANNLDARGSSPDAPLVVVIFDARPVADDAGCVPTVPATEVCDGVDNDCNGKIDDVDVGGDGIFDCQHIAILGNPGVSPSSNFTAWLQGNGSQVDRLLTTGTPMLTAALIAPYQVIIVDDLPRSYSSAEAAALASWVEAGGGLMTMTGYTGSQADIDNPNSLLAPFNLAYAFPLTSGPVTMFAVHPVTAGLSSVTFQGGFGVTAVDADAGTGGAVTIPVATITSRPVGVVQTRGKGRIFAWGDEWITFDSQWSTMPMIKAFWVDILGWLEGLR